MKIIQRVKPHLLKVTLTLAATLLIVQYWRHVALETQPLFTIETVKNRMRILESAAENVTTVFDGSEELNSSSSHNSSQGVPLALYSHEPITRLSNETVLCPPIPPNLNGPIDIATKIYKIRELEKQFTDLEPGGMFKPKECKARYVVALVIPYRDRPIQLSVFLNNIHRLLMKQQIDYGIFVIEQYDESSYFIEDALLEKMPAGIAAVDGTDPFNRGKLMNVGFVEASKIKQFDCFIFHDVDLIPEDDRNLYTCPEQPRHMSVAIDKFKYKLPYKEIFGGVCALSKEHFELTNGFSNLFWGWGGEDDDMYSRVRRKGLHVSRYPPTIARYTMLPHDRQAPNPKRFEIMQKGKKLYGTDGLSNLDYEKKSFELKRLYTWILVDLHPPR